MGHDDIKKLFKNGKPVRQFTDEEIAAIERDVQISGEHDPDNTYLPDGRTVTQAREDYRNPKKEEAPTPIPESKKATPQPTFQEQTSPSSSEKKDVEVKPD